MKRDGSAHERMAAIDLAWLRMERETNPMTIVGVMTLKGRVRCGPLRSLLETRLLRFERFRQIPMHDVFGSYWREDAHFDLEAHLHTLVLPPPADQAALETAVSDLASTQLEARRPMWQIHLIEQYGKGSAVILRFHHCYADGMALLRVVLALTDPTTRQRRARSTLTSRGRERSWLRSIPLAGAAVELSQTLVYTAGNLLSASLRALVHPQHSL
ncbi:MAG: wax ester/triacylglycerol synthase domain-containing protein, partial [Steroidobacteraceae bacterium]